MRSDYVAKKDLQRYRLLYERAKQTNDLADWARADTFFNHMMAAYNHTPDKVEDFDIRTGRIVCGLGDGRNEIRYRKQKSF